MEAEKSLKPMYSHLIMYEKPKVAIIKGSVEKVFGMLISQSMNEKGQIISNRTILTDEELNCYDDVGAYGDFYIFKTFPDLRIEDFFDILLREYERDLSLTRFDILLRERERDLSLTRKLNKLKKIGCAIPPSKEKLILKIREWEEEYDLYIGCHNFYITKRWLPADMEMLYNIQSFWGRNIILEEYEPGAITPEKLELMNNILKNQYNHEMLGVGSDEEAYCFYNDGVMTYSDDGTSVPMTRNEFLKKYPKAEKIHC